MKDLLETRILVVDDQRRMAEAIAVALRRDGHQCDVYTDAGSALEAFERHGADVVITDQRMPGIDGIELIDRLRERQPDLPIILVTAYGDISTAVAAMRAGAFDYVTKPFDNEALRHLVRRALELDRLQRENRLLRRELGERVAREVIAESHAMRQVFALVDRAAPTRAPVLIQGESGTGKEIVARQLHFHGDRVGRPFIAINCKAFAPTVLESELFGHEKGAFTGAHVSRPGCFERADKGTLFLDEIGEVDEEFQVKILRVLQEGEVLRVGGDRPRSVDVRIIAATNKDLQAEMQVGRFREDLFFRLNVIPIHLPSLRQRRDDILPLARHFLERHARENNRFLDLSASAEERLLDHAWPGNVRELENVIERAVILARGERVETSDLFLESLEPAAIRKANPVTLDGTLQEILDRTTREAIHAALDACGGRRGEASQRLGIDRTTLYRLMKRLEL